MPAKLSTLRGTSKQADSTTTIISKWNQQGSFIRFLDGNKLNCAVTNLAYVTIQDAMAHIDWVVDWDMDLTPEERNLVLTPQWRAGLSFSKK